MLHPGYKQQFFLCVLCASARVYIYSLFYMANLGGTYKK